MTECDFSIKKCQAYMRRHISRKQFAIDHYFQTIEGLIKEKLYRKTKNDVTYDILDTPLTTEYKMISLKERQKQMKIGEIWQIALGNFYGFQDLGIGHETGLDIISYNRKIAIELKNRTNTDNSSAKKSNLDKLANFKKQHPDFLCVYGNINDSTESKTLKGSIKTIEHNGVILKQYIGIALLNLILEDNTNYVINKIKEILLAYSVNHKE